jgi:SNF2 family DNA or RNA helicase
MNTTTPLLDHQIKAVRKLLPSRVGGLFMEMGTGKTRVVIELAHQRQARIGNVVYFCPVSLKETVRRELLRHTDLAGADICVFDDKTSLRRLPLAFWYIIGIESISASNRQVLAANAVIDDRSMVVVDESGYIKGHKSLRTQRITRMAERARYRLVMTGTPLSQGVVDLYAQMRFLSWRILGYKSFYSFARNHLEYSDRYPGMIVAAHNVPVLAAKVQPYTYQVTKSECMDLPAKAYATRWYGMTERQRAVYEQAKTDILMCIEDYGDLDSYTIFRLFTALQQIACGFWNRKHEDGSVETVTFPHMRLDVFAATIAQIPTGEKAVIWSKYRRNIEEIVALLNEEYGAGSVAQFHGGLSERARNAEIERFRNDARFLVATQASGGHGLTLNEAGYHIFYSNGFKYAERIQAEDRSHRIGQTRNVHYIDIVCDGSIDERIASALIDKADALEQFKRQVDKVKDKRSAEVRKLVAGL